MKRYLRFGASAGMLSLAPLLISGATFISVPILLGTLGTDLWVSIAIGQAIGEIARALVVWGWNSIGLTVVSPMEPAERLRYYFASLLPRFLVLIPVAIGCVVAAYAIPSEDPASAVRMAFVGAVYGLTGGWLLIANREPLLMVICDALPRAASILIASVMLLFIPSPDVYGWTNILGSVVAVAAVYTLAVRRSRAAGVTPGFGTFSAALAALRHGLPIVGSGLVMVLRISFAVLAAPFLAPAATEVIALGDKFFRWANTAMTPVLQTLLVRIPRMTGSPAHRAVRGLQVAWLGGLLVGAASAAVIVPASSLISHGLIQLDVLTAIPIGIAVTMVFVAGVTGNSVLVMLGRVRQVFAAAVTALIVLVATAAILGPIFGSTGVFWAFAAAETTVVVYQTVAVFRELRRQREGI
ncbi:hypothetical protein ACOKGD_13110 [Microbacterium phosphatis]|uniref:hypothetical protein n=1 Tax=Microbacterium phosphatis TaxID=3140248 RepID=UPI00314089EB